MFCCHVICILINLPADIEVDQSGCTDSMKQKTSKVSIMSLVLLQNSGELWNTQTIKFQAVILIVEVGLVIEDLWTNNSFTDDSLEMDTEHL